MKHFLFVLLFIALSTALSAQGLTRYGQIKTGPSNDFVDKNGRLGSIPMIEANGKVLFDLTTTAVSTITNITASSGGDVTSVAAITARGVCWSTSPAPTVALPTKTSDGTGNGGFTSALTGLASGTLYYVRAYATNADGTGYGNEVSFTSAVSDIDGNVYSTVTIGTQVWMAENLKTTKYNDGSSIPLVTDNAAWTALSTHGYCWYNNDITNKNTYGALYNWYAVNSGNLAPAGWHVATDAEWKQLEMTLGMTPVEADATGWRGIDQGTQLKNTSGWSDGNGTNTSGFSSLPGGFRYYSDGDFMNIGISGLWWSSLEYRLMSSSNANVFRGNLFPTVGMSVRCVRD